MDDMESDSDGKNMNRAQSFILNRNSDVEVPVKYKTANPSVINRWRRATFKRKVVDVDSEVETGTPVDDLICLESFEDLSGVHEPAFVLSRDNIRSALQDMLKSGGCHSDVISDVETPGRIFGVGVDCFLQGYSHFERNVAFLAAALFNRNDLIKPLLGREVDKNFYEPKLGLTALHISAFIGGTTFTNSLLAIGCNVNTMIGAFSPLHCATLANNVELARILLKAGAAFSKAIPNGRTPLHTAIYARSHSCVELFVEYNADVNAVDSSGLTPLQVAADLGDVISVKILLGSGRCDVQKTLGSDENTALHLAAQGGAIEVVNLLLDHGASSKLRNSRQKTPLHLSSRVCVESTELLLKAGADPNAADADKRTPLHTAVSRSEVRFGPEITSLLLAWSADVNKQDRYGYTPLHIAALNELTESVESMVRHGANICARTRGGTAALGLMARKTPTALGAVQSQLDAGIFCNDPEVSYREVKLSFNFRYLLQGCERGDMNFLQTFVNEGQREFLEHPLCRAFLHMKWQKIRKYYAARLIFCFLLVVLLSIYSLTALAYQCYNDAKKEPENGPDFGPRTTKISFDASLCTNKSELGAWLRGNPRVIETEWFVLSVITCLEVLRKLYGLQGYKSVREYFSLSNLVEWFVVFAAFAVSFVYTGETYVWQNHVGAFAVLFGWANLMVMIGQLPTFGSYVAMYTKVQKEFAKLLSAYICLLIGFTFCFCAIFVQSEEFDNPFVGFIKILVMMTGEFDFGDLLKNISKEGQGSAGLLLETSALITFVLFLLFVTIILINLLVGIAVHDIQGLKKTAGLSKLVGLTNLISHIEAALFGSRVPSCVHKLLNSSCGIPRVVVSVRPLNPQENRLPREIMRAGLDIARQQRDKGDGSKLCRRTTVRRKYTETDTQELVDIVTTLAAEIRELRQVIENMKR